MVIDYNYKQVEVPQEIIKFCDYYTIDAKRDDLRYLDCVYMNMGYYGNDLDHLRKFRREFYGISKPIFK